MNNHFNQGPPLDFVVRHTLTIRPRVFNFSCRKVGGLRFLKLGRFCFMFCLTREYKPL